MSDHGIGPPASIATRSNQKKDAVFTGWQTTTSGELFPLYTITMEGHALYHSTVSDARLRSLQLRVPRTPSPYPNTPTAPWHTLGVELDSPATAKEAMQAAKLDYTVITRPMKEILLNVALTDWATMRTDRDEVLGIVSKEYQPLQNIDAFEFMDALVTESEATYETAGLLGRGERIWMLAKLPGYIKVHGKDIICKYLLLTNNHDDSSLVRMKVIPIRLFCNNSLSAALKGEGEFYIEHKQDLKRVHFLLEQTNTLFSQLDTTFNRMSTINITDNQMADYVKKLVPDTEEPENFAHAEETRRDILKIYDADIARGTSWGAFNSFTEYADHLMPHEDPDSRLHSIWFGRAEQLKQKAFQWAEDMMQN